MSPSVGSAQTPTVTGPSRLSEHGARTAAGMHGITVEEYRAHEDRDEHWCPRCNDWLPRKAFQSVRRNARGVESVCKHHRYLALRSLRHPTRPSGVTYAGPDVPSGIQPRRVIARAPRVRVITIMQPSVLTTEQLAQAAATATHLGVPVGVLPRSERRAS